MRQRLAELWNLPRALLRRYPHNESQHLFALTLLVGVVCGLVAVAFHLAIRGAEKLLIDRALHTAGFAGVAWTIITPAVGGLIAGAVLTWVVPGARGSGIPQVKQAFAAGGPVRTRDAVGKFLVGALQIGSGASLGREGPTVQICAGATSLLARATSLPLRNMRRLLPVGVAAGIAAAFNAPIAAVTFTIEEVVGTLDHSILSGVVVAAALAAVIERGILGAHPVIAVGQAYTLDHPSSLLIYALLGGMAALVSVGFTDGLLGLRLWFRKFKALPAWMTPGVGGLVTGVLAAAMLWGFDTSGVTGGGYETLGRALAGGLGLRALVLLCVVKVVATTFSYSSGGAGGIFAPSLFVGAMLGGALGHLDVAALGHESRQLGAFALVGMGAVFAGVIRAPITSVLIIFEMTGAYGLVLPLMLANMTSFMVARRMRPTSIYEALLAQDGVVLPHAGAPRRTIEHSTLSDASASGILPRADTLPPTSEFEARALMAKVVVVPAAASAGELAGLFHSTLASALVVRDGALFTAIVPDDLRDVVNDDALRSLLIAVDVARPMPTVGSDVALPALVAALAEGEGQAVLVLDGDGKEPLGVITREALSRALLRRCAAQPALLDRISGKRTRPTEGPRPAAPGPGEPPARRT